MKKIIFAVFCIGFLTSCMTDAKVARLAKERGICPTVSDSIRIKDSVVVHHRDTVISVPEKEGPEIDIALILQNDSLQALLDSLAKKPIVKKKNGITVTVKSNGKNLVIDAKDDSSKILLRDAITDRDFYRSEYERLVKQEKCLRDHHSDWDTFCNRVVIGLIVLIILAALYGVYRIRKWWISNNVKFFVKHEDS